MKPRLNLTLAVVMTATLTAGMAEAATFTSTAMLSMLGSNGLPINSLFRRADNNGQLASASQNVAVTAGSTSVTLTADTTTDRVHFDAISFVAASMSPQSKQTPTFAINYDLLVAPANFPLPPVFQNIAGDYYAVATYTSLTTSAAPTLLTSANNVVGFNGTVFTINDGVTLTLPNLTVAGTYQAFGPSSSTAAVPFSYTLAPQAVSSWPAQAEIPGGPGFGNGFPFTPTHLNVTYAVQGSVVIFDQVVDNVRVQAQANSITIDYFSQAAFVPEPSSAALAGAGPALLGFLRRRG